MRKRISMTIITVLAVCLACTPLLQAADRVDLDTHRFCAYCGMDRKAYGFSRMLINYDDGTTVGVCSLHCAVIDMAEHSSRAIRTLLVADRNTRILIDATTAFWVSGGEKRGVMTQRPSWAFSTAEKAKIFIQQYGGTISTWKDVFAAAKEEVDRERR
jgi:copper chaperone NosL